MNIDPIKILVLNGDNRNGLAILRSLGVRGYVCDITTHQSKPILRSLTSALKSRHVRQVHFLPPLQDEHGYRSALISLIQEEAYKYILAAGTEASNFLSKNKEGLSAYARPLIEDYDKVWKVHNKIECMRWAKSIGVPVPQTHIIMCLDDLKEAVAAIDTPVVVKYPDSAASKGLWMYHCGGSRLFEEYIRRVPQIASGNRGDAYPLIQERISGTLMDTAAFAVKGKTYAVLSQERILTAWLDGGGGLVNLTNDEPELKAYTKKILQHLRWTGPIEMDWIKDSRTGRFKLLEINPKFWGTTQLTISSGLDYPSWLLDFAESRDVHCSSRYKVGLMYRWIFEELHTILALPSDQERLVHELLLFIGRFRYKPCMTDIWLCDVRPSIKEFLSLLIRLAAHGTLFKAAKTLLSRQQNPGLQQRESVSRKFV